MIFFYLIILLVKLSTAEFFRDDLRRRLAVVLGPRRPGFARDKVASYNNITKNIFSLW